jgi:flagellar biogenesis protein FliO
MESTQKHWWIVVGLGMALPAMADEGSGNPSAVRVNEAIALDSITVPVPMPAISPSPTPAPEPLPEFEDNFAEMIDGLYASPADWDEGLIVEDSALIAEGPTERIEAPAPRSNPQVREVDSAVSPTSVTESVVASSQQAAAKPDAVDKSQTIPRRERAVAQSAPAVVPRSAGDDSLRAGAGWYRHPLVGLAAVLGVIVALTMLARRYLPSARPIAPEALHVVGRAPISPKQSAVLLHVGNRLVLVGVGAEGMRTLAEITDPAEVSQLLGQTVGRNQKTEAGFEQLLADQLDEFEEAPANDADDDEFAAMGATLQVTRDELASLRTRIRALQSA